MYILKSKTFANGISGDCWRVSLLNLDFITMKGRVVIDLYKDAAAALANPLKIPGSTLSFPFSMDPVNVLNNSIAAAYPRILTEASVVVRPAVEAVEEVLDGEGNVITPARAAIPAVHKCPDLVGGVITSG